ncbi:MAG: hypothetical protein R2788_03520 [Saprospiraceae bacterium]
MATASDGFVESRHCGWTVTDECGNLDSLFFTVIIQMCRASRFIRCAQLTLRSLGDVQSAK